MEKSERKAREEAEATVEAVKEKAKKDVEEAMENYNEKVEFLVHRENIIINLESKITEKESNLNKEITTKAASMIANQISNLERDYKNKTYRMERGYNDKFASLKNKYRNMIFSYKGMVFFTLFYGIFSTIITAWKTEVFRSDIIEFFQTSYSLILNIIGWINSIATFASKLGNLIPQSILAIVVHWVIVVAVYIVIFIAFGWLVFRIGKKYLCFFKKKQADEISVFVGLMIIAIIVFAADFIVSIVSINLVGMMLVLFVVYTVIRGVYQAENKEAKRSILKYFTTIIVFVVGIVIIIHFFGAIGIIAIPIGGLLAMIDK